MLRKNERKLELFLLKLDAPRFLLKLRGQQRHVYATKFGNVNFYCENMVYTIKPILYSLTIGRQGIKASYLTPFSHNNKQNIKTNVAQIHVLMKIRPLVSNSLFNMCLQSSVANCIRGNPQTVSLWAQIVPGVIAAAWCLQLLFIFIRVSRGGLSSYHRIVMPYSRRVLWKLMVYVV